MDLQFLFEKPIIETHTLSPGYEDHASDVWLVKVDAQEVVVRSSKMTEEPSNDFWWGCKQLFGIDPRRVFDLESINNTLSDLTSIPVPRILNKGMSSSREFVVVERLKGEVVHTFIDQPSSVIQSFGEGLAEIHRHHENYVGNPSGSFKIELNDFNHHVKRVMGELVSRFYSEDGQIKDMLEEMNDLLDGLSVPKFSTFVLVDLDPTQFISDGQVITGLVDTEAYVIAPRELDFIGLEYILDKKSALDFKIGYEKVMRIPDLTNCRKPYRYLYRLLSVQGKVDMDTWLDHDKLF